MRIELHDTYKIAGHWLAALINGDETGLSDDESEQLQAWLETLPPGPHMYNVGECAEFARDCVSGLMADCYETELYVPEKTCKILSIDAWRNEGGWDWNNWHKVGDIPLAACDWTPRKLLKWFRDNNYLNPASAGKCAVEDDQYNIVIVHRHTRRPLFAIEYGPHY